MKNLLSKLQILQFIIIISLTYFSKNLLLENKSENKDNIDKFINNINLYDSIIKNNINDLTNNKKNLNINSLLNNNEYFYYFYNKKNILVYFFKENNTEQHNIYFNGFFNLNDLKTIISLITNNFTIDNIKNLLDKEGNFYKILNNDVILYDKNNSLLHFFDLIFNEVYNKNNSNKKIKLKITGFSLGGPISQVFIYLLLEKYKDIFELEITNIESWFNGNIEEYNKFKELLQNSSIQNIYNRNSLLYLNNKLFQNFFEITNLIDKENDENKYIYNIFPVGIIKYIIDNHLIDNNNL